MFFHYLFDLSALDTEDLVFKRLSVRITVRQLTENTCYADQAQHMKFATFTDVLRFQAVLLSLSRAAERSHVIVFIVTDAESH